MKESSYSYLSFLCTNSNHLAIKKVLNENTGQDNFVNVLYNNGSYFNTAISHDNPSLIKILLDYMYDTKQIESDPKNNNTDQSIRYTQLQQILKEAKKEYTISEEVNSILASFCKESDLNDSYVDFDNLSTHEQEYHDIDLTGNAKLFESDEF